MSRLPQTARIAAVIAVGMSIELDGTLLTNLATPAGLSDLATLTALGSLATLDILASWGTLDTLAISATYARLAVFGTLGILAAWVTLGTLGPRSIVANMMGGVLILGILGVLEAIRVTLIALLAEGTCSTQQENRPEEVVHDDGRESQNGPAARCVTVLLIEFDA